ncbi:type VI secretion system lipoprotein TssJ [Comamonas sp. GB3 AK4-5]|uniref:type VI secretion system lipoprotein TssJ n=1 Tax=Comamonas sp. GB3 AK4-5 TaxID=3231487 RepID=UPI00351EC7E8
MKPVTHFIALTIITLLLPGCASPVAAIGSAALQIMGVGKPEVPEEQKPPRQMKLQLQAGANLNADEKQQAQAAVVRIYHLKDANAFWLVPYDTFVLPDRDRAALGSSLVSVQEITLSPGQTYNVIEKVPQQAKYVGIVTLFYAPAPQRWRIAFDAEKSEKDGILVGIHACAMTATRGSIQSSQAPEQTTQTKAPQWGSLVSINCPAAS